MKKAFTVVEVTVLFLIFLTIACLVVPISIDDTNQIKNISSWKRVHSYFLNLYVSSDIDKNTTLEQIVMNSVRDYLGEPVKPYKIKFMNNDPVDELYQFETLNELTKGGVIGFKWIKGKDNRVYGLMLFDANGKKGPNVWGKDVFGLSIYNKGLEPFGKNDSISVQRSDCSKYGRGISCSHYYLIGGNYE